MKTLSFSIVFLSIFLLHSCASVHKTGVSQENIPSDISQAKYKVLFTEINFDQTVSKHVASVHNNAAHKHISKKMGDHSLFIPESELSKESYADYTTYRYVLINRITKKVTKTHYRTGPNGMKMQDGKTDSYVTEFYWVDRLTGKEYPHVKGTTMPLYMLKAIVNKVASNQS
ncbi:hypothetical protein [Flavisolibacter tropicus]|uniref:Lipoprotein n=1 Tax=Flavisolibacter tropicus TaxID=1492898 RepID=A0A172U075_9BACT|nr:hypothetical protein [Flavisolibacter tropicus]ANE52656.1 hypothetical protein SY85_21410 [Flavisolibacter tropicus]